MTGKVKIELSPTMFADSKDIGVKSEPIPEVVHVVETALARFLRLQKQEMLKQATLPVREVQKATPDWVPVSSATPAEPDESEQVPEVAEGEAKVYDEDSFEEDLEQDLGQEESVEEGPIQRSYLGIPPENESGLVDPSITLDESQDAALESMMNKQYACLIGAAGSGKTTCTKSLVHRLFYDPRSTFKPKKSGGRFNVAFVAFTGAAVQVIKQNLPEWLHESCMTIHSLLEYRPQETVSIDKVTGLAKVTTPFLPFRDESNTLFEDLLIIDEASMLDMILWNNIRRACKEGTRVVMIGDLNQLPPMFGEPIFAYAMSQWHVSELTHIHRQKGNAGKIVDIAHAILNGNLSGMVWDKMSTGPEWRVVGSKIDQNPQKAARQILATVDGLRRKTFTDGSPIYDPFRDRIMTAGNGYGLNGETTADLVQQQPINEALALMIQPSTDETPRYIIDAGRATKYFAVGNRVMATKNESPSKKNRVTNGMTGVIVDIFANADYTGDKMKVGPEHQVRTNIRRAFGLEIENGLTDEPSKEHMLDHADYSFDDIDMEEISSNLAERLAAADTDEQIEKADSATWASHTVVVKFVNGATREFWAKPAVESLHLAYASTVAKCQGSQFPTAIIVVHHIVKSQLSREWLYTAVTRAQSHVIILYTEFGLRYCFNKQKIKGKNLAEKIERYREWYEGVNTPMGGVMRKNITLEVGPGRD